MRFCCVKTEEPIIQYPLPQIDFHELFKKQLINQKGNFYELLNFLNKTHVMCLADLVRALFHPSLSQKLFKFALSKAKKIDKFIPPKHLVKGLQYRGNPKKEIASIKKQILPKTNLSNVNVVQKDLNDVFSRSSCPNEDNYQKQFNFEDDIDLRKRQQQIEERLDKVSEALRGATRACELQKSFQGGRSQSRLQEYESQGPSSFISRESPPTKTFRNMNYGDDKMHKTSFHSGSPKQKSSKSFLNEGMISLKKMQTLKQNVSDNSKEIELSNYSRRSNRYQEEEESVVDKYEEIKQFYEGEIAKYKQELEYLKNRLVIWQNDRESSVISKNLGSIVSKQSKDSIVSNEKKSITMKLCSAQVNQFIKEITPQVIEYGTIMSQPRQSCDSQFDKNSKSSDPIRKHANSMIIRLFRDSKMFPIEYSKKQSPVRFVMIRQKIQSIFESFYTKEVYRKNPIKHTNLILCYEQKQPKRYFDYLKDYKSWLLIGKVSAELYIGAYINLKQGPKTQTKECFLFSMTKEGDPYILSAKTKILDPMKRIQYINFGDSEFKIKSGTKVVSLSLQDITISFQEIDGNQPNTKRFSMKYGQNIELQELEIHQIVFSADCNDI